MSLPRPRRLERSWNTSRGTGPSLRRLRTATLLLFVSFALLVAASGAYYLNQQHDAAIDGAMRTARVAMDTVQSEATLTFGETLRVADGVADLYREQIAHNQVDEASLHKVLADKAAAPARPGALHACSTPSTKASPDRVPIPVDVSMILTSGMSLRRLHRHRQRHVLRPALPERPPRHPADVVPAARARSCGTPVTWCAAMWWRCSTPIISPTTTAPWIMAPRGASPSGRRTAAWSPPAAMKDAARSTARAWPASWPS